ncbi:MAG: type II toxin-antitoxin system VapC family toxin [Coriobacteriia bacterium]|nr:type II toxin-antitoxin system VapC family toxin [Coriobacteriia bacterium]
MTWFLDTNICIECLRGSSPSLKETLQSLEPSRIRIPSMVKAELLHGAAKSAQPQKNSKLVVLFLQPFEITAFDDGSAQQYSIIRTQLELAGQIIGFNDLIIAATVMAHEGVLVTSNTKEFERVQGLGLENWVKVAM